MIWSWFRRRRLAALSNAFGRLLREGDVAAALELYDARLAPHRGALDRPIRVLYHLHRWLLDRRDEDYQAIHQLAEGQPDGWPVARTWQLVQRLRSQTEVARALARREPASLPQEGPASADDALQTLARAVLQACRAAKPGAAAGAQGEAAQAVLRYLPMDAVPEGKVAIVRAHLLAWASATLRQPEKVLTGRALLEALPEKQRAKVLLAAGFAQACDGLSREQLREAVASLDGVAALASDDERRACVLAVGLRGWHHEAEAAGWFLHFAKRSAATDPPAWRQALLLALALAQFRIGKHHQGREWLAELAKRVQESGPVREASEETLAACFYLTALSLLAGTREWEAPGPDGTDRERAIQNRALWKTLRDRLGRLISQLTRFSPEVAWRGHLLRGLVACVDTGTTLDPESIGQFAAAIDRVGSETARSRLKALEGMLVARARATDEARELVRRRDPVRLRELKETVLDSLGDALPPLLRAAVYLTLWQIDPGYDPMPELRRIPVLPGGEALLGQATSWVQAASTAHRLGEECGRLGHADRTLPPLAPLAACDAELARLGRLATGIIHLRRGDWAAARESLPEADDGADGAAVTACRFYAAWQQADVETCRALAATAGAQPFLARQEYAEPALRVRELLKAIGENRGELARAKLLSFDGGGLESVQLPLRVVALVVWLIERQRPQAAHALLQELRREGLADPRTAPPELVQLSWTCLALTCVVAAQLGQYTACMEAVDAFLGVPGPPTSPFGGPPQHDRLQGWLRLLRLASELALTAQSADDINVRWRAVRRSLEARARDLGDQPRLRPFIDLVSGLLAFISADTLVDDETVARLRQAQQVLVLGKGAAFVERAIGQLNWRKQVIQDFWDGLRRGDLKHSWLIYHEELLPAFGEPRMPHSIQLGMILADWDAAAAPVDELLRRLDALRHAAPELSPPLFERVREYLRDGEQVRRLIRLLGAKQFPELIDAIDHATWTGCERGSMPLPVAIAQMYAYLKTRRTDEAQRMGTVLADSPGLAGWVRDDGLLLQGYVLFEAEKYPEAAQAFERTSQSEIVGHDVDRYWAAAQFAQGLALLAVDQKEKAFDAFARSLGKRGGAAQTAKLAPLFLHFGLRSMEARNGNRARHAFVLLGQGLDGLPPSPEVVFHRLLADVGQLLCRTLMDEDLTEFGGDKFLELVGPLKASSDLVPADMSRRLEQLCRTLAVCQDLRREGRLARPQRSKPAKLAAALRAQVEEIEKLRAESEPYDPVLLALKGVLGLVFPERGQAAQALAAIEQAIKLGAHSHRLAELLETHRKQLKESQEKRRATLDLFDAYLVAGDVPADVRNEFIRTDDLAALYRLNRTYTPTDLTADEVLSGVQALQQRLSPLLDFASSPALQEDPRVREAVRTAKDLVEQLGRSESRLLEAERTILEILAGRLRTESLESV
jgi:hypothetical protein